MCLPSLNQTQLVTHRMLAKDIYELWSMEIHLPATDDYRVEHKGLAKVY